MRSQVGMLPFGSAEDQSATTISPLRFRIESRNLPWESIVVVDISLAATRRHLPCTHPWPLAKKQRSTGRESRICTNTVLIINITPSLDLCPSFTTSRWRSEELAQLTKQQRHHELNYKKLPIICAYPHTPSSRNTFTIGTGKVWVQIIEHVHQLRINSFTF